MHLILISQTCIPLQVITTTQTHLLLLANIPNGGREQRLQKKKVSQDMELQENCCLAKEYYIQTTRKKARTWGAFSSSCSLDIKLSALSILVTKLEIVPVSVIIHSYFPFTFPLPS